MARSQTRLFMPKVVALVNFSSINNNNELTVWRVTVPLFSCQCHPKQCEKIRSRIKRSQLF